MSPRLFREHLAVIRDRFSPASLEQIVSSHGQAPLPPGSVAVTFDDGYREVLEVARPLLAAAAIPATVFVVTGMIDGGREFWWDTLERIFLRPGRLPDHLTGPEGQQWTLGDAADYPATDAERHRTWNWRVAEDPTARHRIFRALHGRLRSLDEPERTGLIEHLIAWAGIDPIGPSEGRTLGAGDVAARRDDQLLEIGAHTVSHSALNRLDPVRQWDEINQSKVTLDRLLGRPVSAFAYPYGTSSGVSRLVRKAGFRSGSTTEAEVVYPRTDRYRLPRLFVGNWPGAELARRLESMGL